MVLLGDVDAVADLGLFVQVCVNAIAQSAVFCAAQAHQGRIHAVRLRLSRRFERRLFLAQTVSLGDELGMFLFQLLQLGTVCAQRLDAVVELVQALVQLVAARFQFVKLLVLLLEALGLVGGERHAGAQFVLARGQVHDGVFDASRTRCVLRKLRLHIRQGVCRRRAGARPRREQLGRHVGGVAQRPQFVAGEREHGLERLLVDVGHQRRVAHQAIGVLRARELDLFGLAELVGTIGLVGIPDVIPCEEQRPGPFGVERLVGVAVPARLFPSEQHAAHEGGERGLACLVAAEHHVEMRRKRTHYLVGEGAEAGHLDELEVGCLRGVVAAHLSSPRLSRSSTRLSASSAKRSMRFA